MPPAESESAGTLTLPADELQKSWYLLGLLLSIGEPTALEELASRCSLFPADPSLIARLCSFPESPISLTRDYLVEISSVGISALAAYVSRFFRFNHYSSPSIPCRDSLRLCLGKRKRVEDEEDLRLVPQWKRIHNYIETREVHHHVTNNIINRIIPPINLSIIVNRVMLRSSLLAETSVEGEIGINKVWGELTGCEPSPVLALPSNVLDGIDIKEVDSCSTCSPYVAEQTVVSPVETGNEKACCELTKTIEVNDQEAAVIDSEKEQVHDLAGLKQEIEDLGLLLDTYEVPDSEPESIKGEDGNSKMPSPDEDSIAQVGVSGAHLVSELSVFKEQLPETSVKKNAQREAVVDPKLPTVTKVVGKSMNVYTYRRKRQLKEECVPVPVVQQPDRNYDMEIKEIRGHSTSISSKDQPKSKELPYFEPYIVECEEGSGGYGTVYRARRKDDGTLVAIKCPHENAHRQHITNELRMLERFGGKNFVIKYQGSLKSAGLDCFILEHVEHDRPEVLKKEIDVFQLQWYAYCMFKALSSLHKQGIVHRDVKPGNFLFSRKTNKGYLIDFNLAMDLYQKCKTSEKSKVEYDTTSHQFTLPSTKSSYPTKSSNFPSAKTLDIVNPIEAKNGKKKTASQRKACNNELKRWNNINSQGADGSGITSAKDGTRSAERQREPLPCQGRKELINFALQNKKHEASRVPAPMRKRIAASPGNLDRQLHYLTPMPLHTTPTAFSGGGLMKTKGDGIGKHKREGSCAGTKGFRAPEVLLRSPHQGPKVDVWSAGVTLLYLIIGRSPFFGDPEQNMKDIAKLRGSEDLWEVAKLHNRELSFPEDLYETQSLSSMNLREWCRLNTKRRDFLDVIPSSLFDLVDKCLTVNPRLRISTDDALRHEFFAPVHECFRKQRSLRQTQSLDSKTNLVHGDATAIKPPRVSLEQA